MPKHQSGRACSRNRSAVAPARVLEHQLKCGYPRNRRAVAQTGRPLIHFSVLGSHMIICISELITYLNHNTCSRHIAFHVHVHVSVRFQVSYHIQVSCLFHMEFQILVRYDAYPHIIHVFLFLDESTLLRNWNHSNRIIQTQVMTFSCQLVGLPGIH